jgi:hypothetical protein
MAFVVASVGPVLADGPGGECGAEKMGTVRFPTGVGGGGCHG